MSERLAVVYIMGRAHSGSTVLDALLSNAPDAVGVGEFASELDRPGSTCSCGRRLDGCSFWTAVRERMEGRRPGSWEETRALTRSQGHLKSFPRTLLARSSSGWVRCHRSAMHELLDAVARAAGAGRVVDSSKEVTRGLFLARFVDEARIVHLVRDPRSAIASDVHRFESGGRGFRLLRRRVTAIRWTPLFVLFVSLRWLVGSALAELVQRFGRERVLRLRFEDLQAEPKSELRRLAAHTGANLDPVVRSVSEGAPLEPGHRLGGNPGMHGAREIIFDRGGRRRPRSRAHRRLVTVVCWPFMVAYGYRLRAQSGPKIHAGSRTSQEPAPSTPRAAGTVERRARR